MKVRASVKKMCDKCKVIHRKGVVHLSHIFFTEARTFITLSSIALVQTQRLLISVSYSSSIEKKVMKVRASVKKMCDKCKVIHRKGVVRVNDLALITHLLYRSTY